MTNEVQNALWGMYDGLNNVRDDATRRRAGQALAGGDRRGAADMLAQGGDLQSASAIYDQMDERQRQDAADQYQIYGQMIEMLRHGYQQGGPEALAQGVQMITPGLLRMPGATPKMVQQLSAEVLANPGILEVWGQQMADEYNYATVGGARIRTNERTGESEVVYQSTQPFSIDGTVYYPQGMEPQQGGGQPEILSDLPPGARLRPRPTEPVSGQPGRAAAFDNEQGARSWVQGLVPGVRVTSGRRSPERNRAVGGADRSYHLSGRALDLVPPQGMSMAALERQLRASGMQFRELLNEGDHVHIAW